MLEIIAVRFFFDRQWQQKRTTTTEVAQEAPGAQFSEPLIFHLRLQPSYKHNLPPKEYLLLELVMIMI